MQFDWAHDFLEPKFLLYSERSNAYLISEDLELIRGKKVEPLLRMTQQENVWAVGSINWATELGWVIS
jgi:hypothetical protein